MSNGTVTTNANIPQIPQPVADVGALANAVQAIKQGMDSLAGNRGSTLNRAVTFNDLINLGVVSGALVTTAIGTSQLSASFTFDPGTIPGGSSGTLALAPQPRSTLFGNAGTVAAAPGPIEVGSGLSLATNGTLSLGTVAAESLLGNGTTVGAEPTSVAVASWLHWENASTLASQAFLPLVNGDTPGPLLIADPSGQCIGVPI